MNRRAAIRTLSKGLEVATRFAKPPLEIIGTLLAAGRAGLKPAPTNIIYFQCVGIIIMRPVSQLQELIVAAGFKPARLSAHEMATLRYPVWVTSRPFLQH